MAYDVTIGNCWENIEDGRVYEIIGPGQIKLKYDFTGYARRNAYPDVMADDGEWNSNWRRYYDKSDTFQLLYDKLK